ncbi:MAG: hypothetical protein KDK51_06445 [Deltaproteobacteria bacterium]|nr:hypothetical protein [Deltaproteobacteria bacterium]
MKLLTALFLALTTTFFAYAEETVAPASEAVAKPEAEQAADHVDEHHAQEAEPVEVEKVDMEIHSGHVHHQANIQVLQTTTTLLFEIDFPADDIKDPSHKNLNAIRNAENIFTVDGWTPDCALTKSSFQKKDLSSDHADYMLSFQYTCSKPLNIVSIDLNPFFDLPIEIETAKTHFIIGEQILPPVNIKKKNALIKLKKH